MNNLQKYLYNSVKKAEETVKTDTRISGMSIFNLKKSNYLIISKKDFEDIINQLKKNKSGNFFNKNEK